MGGKWELAGTVMGYLSGNGTHSTHTHTDHKTRGAVYPVMSASPTLSNVFIYTYVRLLGGAYNGVQTYLWNMVHTVNICASDILYVVCKRVCVCV